MSLLQHVAMVVVVIVVALVVGFVVDWGPLDQFERLGLDAVRRGEHLVWTPEAPRRMFGAIRARTQCLECHVNARRGDLLGAFTYYLEVPVDELAKPESKRDRDSGLRYGICHTRTDLSAPPVMTRFPSVEIPTP